MSNRKEILLTQLCSCHNQDGWFAPLSFAQRGLTADQAVQKPVQSANSILGIIRHLVFWNERYLQRFKEGAVPPLEISNAKTFERSDSCEVEGDWDNMRQKSENVFTQWEDAIISCDDAKLDTLTHPDQKVCWWTSLAHLSIHNAYHIGQIVHIRKELGLWESWEE